MSMHSRPRTVKLSPLVLRLAVAGILGVAGLAKFTDRHEPLPTDVPSHKEGVPLDEQTVEMDPITGPDANLEERSVALDVDASDEAASAEVSVPGTDLEVSFGWYELVGALELGFAAVLLLGFLVRLAALVGVSGVTVAGLAANDIIVSPNPINHLQGLYEGNPMAMLLLGAICLSLLVSGSGAMSLDRLLFGRDKEPRRSDEQPVGNA